MRLWDGETRIRGSSQRNRSISTCINVKKKNPTGQNSFAADMIAPILTPPTVIARPKTETYIPVFSE